MVEHRLFSRCQILASRCTSSCSIYRNPSHRRMDWLDNGNNTPAETNRRNNNGNGREERRTKDGRAKTRGTSSRNDGRRKENGKEKKKLKSYQKQLLILPQAAAPSSLFFQLYNFVLLETKIVEIIRIYLY